MKYQFCVSVCLFMNWNSNWNSEENSNWNCEENSNWNSEENSSWNSEENSQNILWKSEIQRNKIDKIL